MANISQIKLPDNTVYDIKDSNAGPRPILHFEDDLDSLGFRGIYINSSDFPDGLKDGLKDGQIIFVIIGASTFNGTGNFNIYVVIDDDTPNSIPIYLNRNTQLADAQLRKGCSFILVYSAQNNRFYAFGLPMAV